MVTIFDFLPLPTMLGIAGCIAIAAGVLYRFRFFLRPRRRGESWAEFVRRALRSDEEVRQAQSQLFGSRLSTMAMAIFDGLVLVVALVAIWLDRSLLWPIAIYVALGALGAPLLTTRPAGYRAMSLLERMTWRATHAWFWPLYLVLNDR